MVDEPFRVVRLLDDVFLVILSDGTAEFVVVHGRAVLATSPQECNAGGIFNLENTFAAVQPSDASSIVTGREQKLTEKLPEVGVLFCRCHFSAILESSIVQVVFRQVGPGTWVVS